MRHIKTIISELSRYTVDLSKRPQIIAINKVEGLDDEIINDQIETLRKIAGRKAAIYAISARSGRGIKELLLEAKKLLEKSRAAAGKKTAPSIPVLELKLTGEAWQVKKSKDTYIVTGKKN